MNDNILSSDPRAMDNGCRRELTRTYSNSSDITVESSHQTANSRLQGQSAEWTNEKHNAYLNCLEASFVQQLHQLRSSMVHGWCLQKNISGPCSSQLLSANTHYSSDQDGSQQKIKFEVNEAFFDESVDSHGMLGSSQKRHRTPVGELKTATSFTALEHNVLNDRGLHTTFSCEPAGSSEQHLDCKLCHPSSDDSATEVSDQNFVDEDQGDKTSCGSTAKRLKIVNVDTLNNDQVLPIGRFHSPNPNVTAVGCASSEREERVHQELLSKHPESFPSPRSNMHYFVRGS